MLREFVVWFLGLFGYREKEHTFVHCASDIYNSDGSRKTEQQRKAWEAI